jgi:hypothetical protein
MEGRFIKIAGIWYEIQTYVSGTSITLVEYTIKGASGSATHIGEVSLLPEGWDDLIWKSAVADYFDFKGLTNPWRTEYEKRLMLLVARYGGGQKTTSQVMRRSGQAVRNPNDYPTGLTE